MEFLPWAAHNWFDLLSSVGIIGSLMFTAVSLKSETKTRRIANLLTMTQNHREIWKDVYSLAQLSRVLDSSANLSNNPVTQDEEVFVVIVIQHINSVYQALRTDLTVKPEGLCCDICRFLSLPVPRVVWERMKGLQDKDFVKFIEDCHLNP